MLQHQEVDDINHKYAGSILYLDGDPIMCVDGVNHIFAAGEKARAVIRYHAIGIEPGLRDAKVIRADDERLADGPYLLGYMNKVHTLTNDGERVEAVCFVTRVPVRRWKQGICQENLHFQGNMMNFRMACKIPEFADMLRGKYPSFNKAVKSLDEEHKAIAYHRHWAVALSKIGNIDIHYRGQLVGTGEDVKSIKLGPKFEYLQDYYQLAKE